MTFMRRSDQGDKYDKRSLSENLRDLDQTARSGPKLTARVLEALYTEPMWLGAIQSVPIAILLARIQLIKGPESPVDCSGLVHFVWEGPPRGARIVKIQGLAAGSERYRFTFLIVEGTV